jgi:hypothetical protein
MALKIVDKSKNNVQIKPKRNLLIVVSSAVGIVVFAGIVWFALSQLLATESYYVLNQDVGSKTQVSDSMLTKVETAKGTAPKNAITQAQVLEGNIYTKIPLSAGDILTPSNTGLNIDNSTGIPDGWSVTTFSIPTVSAVNGNITKGQYFDIIGVSDSGIAKYIASNILALDVDSGISQAEVTNDSTQSASDIMQITVGMPADKIALLHSALTKYPKIELALAPKSLSYETRDNSYLDGNYNFDDITPGFDLYDGTDSTFSVVKRDENGKPIKENNTTKKSSSTDKE